MLTVNLTVVVDRRIRRIDITEILARNAAYIAFAGNSSKDRVGKVGQRRPSCVAAYHAAYIVAAVNLAGITSAADTAGVITGKTAGVFIIIVSFLVDKVS